MLEPYKNFSSDELVDRFLTMKEGELIEIN
jgi:hypothetical protein